jgi:hypothetical protein
MNRHDIRVMQGGGRVLLARTAAPVRHPLKSSGSSFSAT